MNCRAQLFLIAALTVTGTAAADSLSLAVSPADAIVRPAASGQLRLPALEIAATIRGGCSDGSEALSLSLSSADSVQFVDLATAAADGSWQTVFSLPASQVPPLAARGFCPADSEPGTTAALRKDAFLSLRVGLRCSDGESERLTTETALVDLNLVCEAPPGEDDQDSSE